MPLDFKLEDLEFKNDTEEQKYELFKEYEFNSLLENMDAAETEDISDFDVENTENLQDLGNKISIHLEVHADNYLYNKPEFIAVTDGEKAYVRSLENIDAKAGRIFEQQGRVNAYDIKGRLRCSTSWTSRFNGFSNDIMMASFLLDPSTKIIDVSETVGPYGININSDDFHYGKGRNKKNPSEEETIEFLTDKVMRSISRKDKMVKTGRR